MFTALRLHRSPDNSLYSNQLYFYHRYFRVKYAAIFNHVPTELSSVIGQEMRSLFTCDLQFATSLRIFASGCVLMKLSLTSLAWSLDLFVVQSLLVSGSQCQFGKLTIKATCEKAFC